MMDRYEAVVKVDEVIKYAQSRQFEKACEILETINVAKIKNYDDLIIFAEVYQKNKKYLQAKEILERIHERTSTRRLIALLISVTSKMHNYVEAEKYYEEYIAMAPRDVNRFILRYKIDKAKGLGYDELIRSLEQLKEFDIIEEWEYELAKLYHKAGYDDKCISECNTIIMMFGAGVIVEKAKLLRDYHIDAISNNTQYSITGQSGADSGFNATVQLNNIIDQVKEKMAKEDDGAEDATSESAAISSDDEDYGEDISISPKIEEEYAKDNDKITDEFIRQEEKAKTAQVVTEIYEDEEDVVGIKDDENYKDSPDADEDEDEDFSEYAKDVKKEEPNEAVTKEEVSKKDLHRTDELKEDESEVDVMSDDFINNLSSLVNDELDKIFSESEGTGAFSVSGNDLLENDADAKDDKEESTATKAINEEEKEDKEDKEDKKEGYSYDNESEEEDYSYDDEYEDYEYDGEFDNDEGLMDSILSIKEKKIKLSEINLFKEVFVKKKDEPFKRKDIEEYDRIFKNAHMYDDEEDENYLELDEIIRKEEEKRAKEESEREELKKAKAEAANEVKDVTKETVTEEKEQDEEQVAEEPVTQETKQKEETIEEPVAIDVADSDKEDDAEEKEPVHIKEIANATEPIIPDYNNSGIKSEDLDEEEYNHVMKWLGVLLTPSMYDASATEDIDEKIFRNYYEIPALRSNIRCAVAALVKNPVTGNFIICGNAKSGRTTIAKMIGKVACAKDIVDSGRIARIDAEKFNDVDLEHKQSKLADGCLIIQRAHLLTPAAMTSLVTLIIHLNGRLVVFLETDYDNIAALYMMTPEVRKYFTNVVSMPQYSKEELIGFAKSYAAYKNFSFSESGLFAMNEMLDTSFDRIPQDKRIPFVLTAVEKAIKAANERSVGGFMRPNTDGLNVLEMQDVEKQY